MWMLAAAAIAQVQTAPDWSADPRLEQKITVRCDSETIGEFASRIGGALGIEITAAEPLAHRRVIASSQNVPAREVMKHLADHFNYSWRTTSLGFEIMQTAAQKAEDERIFRRRLVGGLNAYRVEARQWLDELQPLSWEAASEKVSSLRREVLEEDRRLEQARLQNNLIETEAARKRMSQLEKQMQDVAQTFNPGASVARQVVAALTDDELVELYTTPYLVFSTAPTPMQRPLNRAAAQTAQELLQAIRRVQSRQGGLTDDDRMTAGQLGILLDRPVEEVASVRVRVSPGNGRGIYASLGEVRVELVFLRGAPASTPYYVERRPPKDGPPQLPGFPPFEGQDRRLADIPGFVERAQEVLKQREAEVRSLADPALSLRVGVSQGTMINDLGRAAGLNVMADSAEALWAQPLRPEHLSTVRGSLVRVVLEAMTEARVEGGWLMLRPRDWSMRRAADLPTDRLLAIHNLLQGAPTLDERARATALCGAFSQSTKLPRSRAEREFLLGWDALSPGQRQSIRQGRAVAVTSLPTRAKTHFYFALMVGGDNRLVDRTNNPFEQDLHKWLRQLGVPSRAERQPQDEEITQRLPQGLLPETFLVRRQDVEDAVTVKIRNVITTYRLRDLDERSLEPGQYWITKNVLDTVVIRPPGIPAFCLRFIQEIPPTGDPVDSYNALPVEFRQMIEEKRKTPRSPGS